MFSCSLAQNPYPLLSLGEFGLETIEPSSPHGLTEQAQPWWDSGYPGPTLGLCRHPTAIKGHRKR